MALEPPDRAASTRGPPGPPPAASRRDAEPPPPKPAPRGRPRRARSAGQPPPPRAHRAAAIRPIRSRHRRRPAPASIPNQTKSPFRAGPRSGHGPAGSGGCTSCRRGGRLVPVSHAAGPERPRPPQPTSEERRKAMPPPSPRAGRVAGDPLRQRRGGESMRRRRPRVWRGARVARAGATGHLVWQNHLNYPGSSALAITIKATPTQTHFKRNNSWCVG